MKIVTGLRVVKENNDSLSFFIGYMESRVERLVGQLRSRDLLHDAYLIPILQVVLADDNNPGSLSDQTFRC